MTFAERFLDQVYAVLLRFYPSSFRDEFGEEMHSVFTEVANRTAARGWLPLIRLVLREMRDWPGAVAAAHWRALNKEKTTMEKSMASASVSSNDVPTLEDRHGPIPWREAVLAGLPHVLMALTCQAAAVAAAYGVISSSGRGNRLIHIALGGIWAFALLAAMLIARREGWPRWWASWFGYGLLLLIGLVVAALKALEPALGDWMVTNLQNAYGFLLAPLLLAIIVCALALRDQVWFLLAILPAMVVLWRLTLEFTTYHLRTVVVLVAWLGAAGAAILIARASRVRTGVWISLVLNLMVGLAYTYARTYHAEFPAGAPAHYSVPPTFLDWLNRFALNALWTSVLILEPLLVRRLRTLGRRTGPLGQLGFRLAVGGLGLLLAAELAASWWSGSGWMFIRLAFGPETAEGFQPSTLAYVAVLLFLSGAIFLGAALARTRLSTEQGASLVLAFALVAAPLILFLPLAYNLWDRRALTRMWGYVLGLPWVALGIWLITRRSGERLTAAA